MLYEPTNIIPSTMTQTGTVAATTDNVNIQWQVNGNSAMTMFQIDVMQNNADSTFVYSTGIVTENPTVAQGYSLPFYGKDRFGDYVQFVYHPNQTWAAWSGNAISDGNSYKFRITQFFQENSTACKVPITSNLSAGTTYYFSYSVNGTTQYVSFTVANAAYFVNGNTIYFNFSHNAGWVATSGTNSRAITDITFPVSETEPSGTRLSGAEAVSSGDTFYNQFFTTKNSASSFITRTESTLTITPLAETPVASATQSFTATYSQAQGDSINTVRWQLYNADDMTTPIDDTGGISTSVLSYEYNGLFDGQSYTVICTVTTESGVTVSTTLDFSVQYEQGTYTGDFTAQSLCHEDANLLKWDNIEGISGDDNPAGSAIVSNGQLILPENSTVTWSEREDGEMGDLNFSAPWTAVWNGEIEQIFSSYTGIIQKTTVFPKVGYIETLSGGDPGIINDIAFSPDGTLCIICGNFDGYASVYRINGASATFLYNITKNGAALTGIANCVDFSPNGEKMVLGGRFDGCLSVFNVNGSDITYDTDLTISGTALTLGVDAVKFSNDGKTLLAGGIYSNQTGYFIVNTNEFVFSQYISIPDETNYSASVIEFNPSGDLVVMADSYGKNAVFSYHNQTFEFVSMLPEFSKGIGAMAFNPSGNLFLCGNYESTGRLLLYRVVGTNFTYLHDITNPNGDSFYESVSFNNTGSLVLIGAGDRHNPSALLYKVNNENISFDDSLQNESGDYLEEVGCGKFTPNGDAIVIGCGIIGSQANEVGNYIFNVLYNFSDHINSISFSPNEGTMICCDNGVGGASMFNFVNNIANYVSDIFRNNTGINKGIVSSAFSPDGSLLVLGGAFSGHASVFSVSGTTVTYLADITKGGAALSGAVNTAAFSPDGSLLVLGGAFSGYASVFSVSGTTVTYIADITKGGAALSSAVNTAAFSPDGSLLVLGGAFSGYASMFSINGTSTSYLSDAIKNGTSLSGVVHSAAFSPDGNVVAFGGSFDGYAAFFSISAGAMVWVEDVLLDESPLNGAVYSLSFSNSGNMMAVGGDFTGYAAVFSAETTIANIEKVFEVSDNNVYVSRNGQVIAVKTSEESILGQTYVLGNSAGGANNILISLTPSALQVYSFLDGKYLGMQETAITYSQQTISSAQLQGKQTCNYFTIIDGDGSNIAANLTDYTWEPEWDNEDYTVDLLANFNYGLDGGTATQTGTGYRIYRRKSDGTENIELATLPSTTISLRDYGIKSNESYIYDFYVYDANGAFMGVRSTEATPLKRQFKRFSLLSTQYNESDNCYHVVKEYQFSCNIQDMTVSNNNNKSYVQNFTPYPTVFQSTANYASGTLQALIGFVDPKAYKYWDSTQLMDELNALSTTTNTLFLKDMKGHLWMVDIGTVQMTATQKTREMQVTISLPWTEIGDASDVSIIQTPEDEGWNNDAQVLDVTLDVDVETGLLQVVYPFPYNGTAFYLVGVTPEGVVSAVQPLPSKASQPTDGQLKAVVRHK